MSAPRRGEFALIERYLAHLGAARGDVPLGPGDDAALLDPQRDAVAVAVAAATDCADPRAAAREPLAAALQALRGAGAIPAWATLALSLEGADEDWLRGFADALHEACVAEGVQVVGGDTTGGGDAVTLFVAGGLPATGDAADAG